MQPGKATAQDVAPLVFELTRAIRARRVHPAAHPVVTEAQRRCESAWQRLSAGSCEFTLEVSGAGLALEDGERIAGPGTEELADELRVRRVLRLQVHGAPAAAEITLLVEALAREPEALVHQGGLAALLRSSGARAIEAVNHTPNRDSASSASAERNAFLTQHIADLVQRLSELERCDSIASYNTTANRIDVCVDLLVHAKRSIDAYRAALVLARHATDHDQRSDAIRREASERLIRLARKNDLLDEVVEQACGASSLASVQASQVLIAIGAVAVPRLLRTLQGSKEGTRSRVTQILVALGDAAVPQVIEELAAQQPERARLAARLLGEMQNPKGVPFLADALGATDLALARDAAQALARIGDHAAVQALIGGLGRGDEVSVICAGCLGGLRHSAALPALSALVDLRSRRTESVRRAAIQSLGRIGNPTALTDLKLILDHAPFFGAARARSLRVAAAQAIGQIGGNSAVQALRAHARRGDFAVRQACEEASRRLASAAKRET
jgi:HEAT repeat protein